MINMNPIIIFFCRDERSTLFSCGDLQGKQQPLLLSRPSAQNKPGLSILHVQGLPNPGALIKQQQQNKKDPDSQLIL
jgi:hypothetical protein